MESAVEKISRNFRKKTLLHTLVFLIISFVLVIGISIFRKQSSSIVENNAADLNKLQEKTVFNDIKIKINRDIFSHDQINHEVRENDLISYYNKNLKKGDTIIYVSHDVGVQQLLMAKLISQSGRVYVFNPVEKYNDAINLSAKENGFENRIITKTIAISDKISNGVLVYKSGDFPAEGSIQEGDYQVESGYHALKVDVSSLDELCHNLQNVDLLRISTMSDIDKVMKGAKNIIQNSPKIKIVADYDREKSKNENSYLEDLKKEGFDIYLINNEGEAHPIDLKNVEKGHILLIRGLL